MHEPETALIAERLDVEARLRALQQSFADVVAYSDGTPPDDEHDPEGATVGWERAQLAALRDQAVQRLADIDAALARLEQGTYGICVNCGRPIDNERLLARPAAAHCIHCATP